MQADGASWKDLLVTSKDEERFTNLFKNDLKNGLSIRGKPQIPEQVQTLSEAHEGLNSDSFHPATD